LPSQHTLKETPRDLLELAKSNGNFELAVRLKHWVNAFERCTEELESAKKADDFDRCRDIQTKLNKMRSLEEFEAFQESQPQSEVDSFILLMLIICFVFGVQFIFGCCFCTNKKAADTYTLSLVLPLY
jgi:hypothetical protein